MAKMTGLQNKTVKLTDEARKRYVGLENQLDGHQGLAGPMIHSGFYVVTWFSAEGKKKANTYREEELEICQINLEDLL